MRSRQPEVVPRVFALCSTLLGRGCFLFAASNGMGLFTAVCDPGVRGKLEEACQPGSSNPVLLSCAKKNGVDRQEEIAQRNPLKGFPLDSFPNRGARPLWLPGLPGTDSVTNRACSRTFEYSLVEGYDKLGRPNSAQSKFSLKISLRGAAFSAMRSPVSHCSPPARHFCRAKMPCGGQVPPNLLLGSIIISYLANQ